MRILGNQSKIVRGILVNEASGEMHEFLFNPEQLTSGITVNWDKMTPIAASFDRLHYRSTSNATFALELIVHRMLIAKRRRDASGVVPRADFGAIRKEFDDRRNFLIALCYPRGLPNDPVRRSPPKALLLWPRFLAVEVVVNSLNFVDSAFAQNGEPISFSASLDLQETRDFRLTSSVARREGFIRTTGSRRGENVVLPGRGRP